MKQSKSQLGLLVAALLSVSVLVAAPVSAKHGADDPVSVSTTASTSDDDGTADQGSGDATDTSTGTSTERVGHLKGEAKSELAKLRSGKAEKTAAQKQKVCENREKAVNNKVKAFGNVAQKHLDRLDGVFTKLQAFQAEKNLTVDNYDTLVATATTNQTAATEAVAALKTVAVDIDCTSADPVSSLTVVKNAAKEARDALKTYRKSLKDIVVAFAQINKTDDSSKGDQ